jgi:hypothetical protein
MIKKNIKNHSFTQKDNNILLSNNLVTAGGNYITHTGLNGITYTVQQSQRPDRFLLTVNYINGETKRFYVNRRHPVSYRYNINFVRNWLPLDLEIMEVIGEPFNPHFFYDWLNLDNQNGLFITLEKLDPTGIILGGQNFHNCFLTEVNYQVVFDRPMGNMEIKISFSNMNNIF